MRSPTFNLSGLATIYKECRNSDKGNTIAFEISEGGGKFLFLIFFDEEDQKKDVPDTLYILLIRTKNILELKMYGKHWAGDFKLYLNSMQEQLIKDELGIAGGLNPFSLASFFTHMNAQIPQHFSPVDRAAILRKNRFNIATQPLLEQYFDDPLKIHLVGPVQLPNNKKPRERTLRKLDLYYQSSPDTIAKIRAGLIKNNCTLQWSKEFTTCSFSKLARFLA